MILDTVHIDEFNSWLDGVRSTHNYDSGSLIVLIDAPPGVGKSYALQRYSDHLLDRSHARLVELESNQLTDRLDFEEHYAQGHVLLPGDEPPPGLDTIKLRSTCVVAARSHRQAKVFLSEATPRTRRHRYLHGHNMAESDPCPNGVPKALFEQLNRRGLSKTFHICKSQAPLGRPEDGSDKDTEPQTCPYFDDCKVRKHITQGGEPANEAPGLFIATAQMLQVAGNAPRGPGCPWLLDENLTDDIITTETLDPAEPAALLTADLTPAAVAWVAKYRDVLQSLANAADPPHRAKTTPPHWGDYRYSPADPPGGYDLDVEDPPARFVSKSSFEGPSAALLDAMRHRARWSHVPNADGTGWCLQSLRWWLPAGQPPACFVVAGAGIAEAKDAMLKAWGWAYGADQDPTCITVALIDPALVKADMHVDDTHYPWSRKPALVTLGVDTLDTLTKRWDQIAGHAAAHGVPLSGVGVITHKQVHERLREVGLLPADVLCMDFNDVKSRNDFGQCKVLWVLGVYAPPVMTQWLMNHQLSTIERAGGSACPPTYNSQTSDLVEHYAWQGLVQQFGRLRSVRRADEELWVFYDSPKRPLHAYPGVDPANVHSQP